MLNVLSRRASDYSSAPGNRLDQPLRLQHSQGLTNRNPRHRELIGKRLLDQPRSRRRLAGDDLPADPTAHMLRQGGVLTADGLQ